MPGVTLLSLCDEALTSQHDGQLVGFSLDNPDEPFGDDFHRRCLYSHHELTWVEVEDLMIPDEEDNEGNGDFAALLDDDGGDDNGDDEVVATTHNLYGDYCRLAPPARVEAIANLRTVIWLMLGITKEDWNPSDDIVVECMKQAERLSPEGLCAWVNAQYMAILREYDDYTHLALMREFAAETRDFFGVDELALAEMALSCKMKVPQCEERRGGRRGPRSRIADRRLWDYKKNLPGTQRQRRRQSSHKSHCEKGGRQDYRHQLPRLLAKQERQTEMLERQIGLK